MKKWTEAPDVAVSEDLQNAVGGHPLLARTLAQRGFGQVPAARAFLDPDYYQPTPAAELPDLPIAVDRLTSAIDQGEMICVWGDFDVDGQTATALLVTVLRDLGADVHFHIPNRQTESHGVNLPWLEQLIETGVTLFLTCDTGITAHQAVEFARERGVDVIITDHHELPPTLPLARATINPKRLPTSHPLRELPGAGVAYKLAEAMYAWADRPQEANQLLDLLALGIVADLAVLTGDTRYLLQRGLEKLRHTTRLGLQAVMHAAELQPDGLTEQHISFAIAPRLNALGRLADANPAVDLLTTTDLAQANILASELEGLNARRKLLCDQVYDAAQNQIQRDPALLDGAALVIDHPSWPAGVIGIVASRLAERYNRPTILIATPPGDMGRGSARSVEGVNITAAIAAQSHMLVNFGGHPMAAGLGIAPERISEFRQALSHTISDMLGKREVRPILPIDGHLPLADLTLDFVREMEQMAPFGPGNPVPVWVSRNLNVGRRSTVGRHKEHLQLILEDSHEQPHKVIWWQGADWPLPAGRFDLAYSVHTSNFRGQPQVEVEWVDARPMEEASVHVSPVPVLVEIVDHRRAPNPRAELQNLLKQSIIQVWSEGRQADNPESGRDRYRLEPIEALAIWTIPPGPDELRAALDKTGARTVHLFAIDPELDEPGQFLQRLAGLAKYAIKAHHGQVALSTLAAATAHREVTVLAGLDLLQAQGHILILEHGEQRICLAASRSTSKPDTSGSAAVHLRALLEETAAYRASFARAEKDSLVTNSTSQPKT